MQKAVWSMFLSLGTGALLVVMAGLTAPANAADLAGSWKGGVLGCGYEMKPGETPKQTLRRMERERVFN